MKLWKLRWLMALAVCVAVLQYSSIGLAMDTRRTSSNTLPEAANIASDGGAGDPEGFKSPLEIRAMMSSLASKSLLNGIAVAGNRIIAVGERGHIIHSDDKGQRWTQSEVPVAVDLTAVCFATPLKGWAVGHSGVVLHSTDGGTTWAVQLDGSRVCQIMKKYYEANPPSSGKNARADKKLKEDIQYLVDQGPVFPFLDVWFENEHTGFVVGAYNLILHTTDGGKNWEPWFDRTDNIIGYHLYAIKPVGKELYMAGEQGLVLKFDPAAGRFRSLQTGYNGTFFGIIGKPGSVIVFGLRGNIYRSTDSGESWNKVESGETAGILGGTLIRDGRILLVTQSGKVLQSRNDGESFSELKRKEGVGIPACAVAVVGNSTSVIAGWNGIQVEIIN